MGKNTILFFLPFTFSLCSTSLLCKAKVGLSIFQMILIPWQQQYQHQRPEKQNGGIMKGIKKKYISTLDQCFSPMFSFIASLGLLVFFFFL